MHARSRRIGKQGLADLAGLGRLEVQTRTDVRLTQRGLCAGQDPQPLADQQSLVKAVPDSRQIDTAIVCGPGPLCPEPCRSLSAEHVERCLRELAVTPRVEQVVDRPQLGRRNPEAQNRCTATIGARLRFVVNNLRLRGDELAEFGHFLLEKRGLPDPRCQGQLDITPSRTAIWDKTPIREE